MSDGPLHLSYRELVSRVELLAGGLAADGVRPGSPVLVAYPRGVDLIVAVLACVRLGAPFVPIDSGHPAERLAAITDDVGARHALAPQASRVALPSSVLRVPAAASDARPTADMPEEWTDAEWAVAPAYVIFTSGSTGRPKGVAVSHRGLPGLVATYRERLRLGPRRRLLQFAAVTFDSFVAEVFPTLLSGATLVLMGRDEWADGGGIDGLLRRERINVVTLPPALLARTVPGPLPDLDVLITAGEACTDRVLVNWHAEHRAIINAYGPTEATVCATMSDPLAPGDRIVVGRPIPGINVAILDAALSPVAPGEVGELCISGERLAIGYVGQPELTRERFVERRDGIRLLRTGDRARMLPGGSIDLVGRADRQIKLHGRRIELGDVEAALLAIPGVQEAVVELETGDLLPRLVAFVVSDLDTRALRSAAADRLPAEMVPSIFTITAELPVTSHGKVDRVALRSGAVAVATPVGSEFSLGADKARSMTEARVKLLWSQALGRADLPIDVTFAELGGTSLQGAALINLLQDECGVRVPLGVLLGGTIATLAAEVDAGRLRPDAGAVTRIHLGRSDTAVWLLPGVLGQLTPFIDLVAALPGELSVFGVDQLGILAPVEAGGALAALADWVADEIAAYGGPPQLALVGYSFGGLLAVEVARRLDALGFPCEAFLLDPFSPIAERPSAVTDHRSFWERRYGEYLKPDAHTPRVDAPEYAVLDHILDGLAADGRTPSYLRWADRARARAVLERFRGNVSAAWAHVVEPFAGPTTVYLTSQSAWSDWDDLLVGDAIRAIGIPGDHDGCVKSPNIAAVAADLAFRVRTAPNFALSVQATATAVALQPSNPSEPR